MKILKTIAALLILLPAAAGNVWAFHGNGGHYHSHVFVGIGVDPFWGPWYYPPPAYYYQSPVVIQSPPVYVEQAPSSAPAANNYWYYCAAAKRYYPYVKDCPGGWQQVAPTPPEAR